MSFLWGRHLNNQPPSLSAKVPNWMGRGKTKISQPPPSDLPPQLILAEIKHWTWFPFSILHAMPSEHASLEGRFVISKAEWHIENKLLSAKLYYSSHSSTHRKAITEQKSEMAYASWGLPTPGKHQGQVLASVLTWVQTWKHQEMYLEVSRTPFFPATCYQRQWIPKSSVQLLWIIKKLRSSKGELSKEQNRRKKMSAANTEY